MRTAESAALDCAFDVDALQAVLREHPVRLAILFGSHAPDAVHPRSDIDLAVEFRSHQPSDADYNDVFLGLSADPSETLERDAIDLVDLHTVSPALATAIFEHGILLVGEQDHAAAVRDRLTDAESDQPSPRERLDASIAKMDAYLGERAVPATGEPEDDG